MDEAHTSRYSVHPGADKMYYDLRDLYWWPGMKRDIAEYVSRCLMCSKIKGKPISTTPPHSTIKDGGILAKIYTNEIVARHGVPVSIISDPDGRFTSHLWQAFQKALVGILLSFEWEFSFYNGLHTSIKCAPFEALYGRKCRSLVIWTEVGESQLIGPKIVQETTEKIVQIKERLKTARSRQKSYADKRRKLLNSIKCVRPVAYRLKLPQELSCVHDTFHVSNLKKCLAEPDVQVPLDEIEIVNLRFVEEPIEIVDRDVKKLKRRRIPLVKVRWNSRQGAEYTWEREDQFQKK
ncbi:putative reverse transcriptase domain-containing protein [Tanacetum coccineum]